MNTHALLQIVDKYALLLESQGAVLKCADLDTAMSLPLDRKQLLSHARWQLEVALRVVNAMGGESVSIRMVSAAQAILISTGLVTVREAWSDNETWLDRASVLSFNGLIAEIDS